MEYGATAFSSVTVLPLGFNLFPADGGSSSTIGQPVHPAAILTPTRPEGELASLYKYWKRGEGMVSLDRTVENQDEFFHFVQHVAMKDLQAMRMNESQASASTIWQGCPKRNMRASTAVAIDPTLKPTIRVCIPQCSPALQACRAAETINSASARLQPG